MKRKAKKRLRLGPYRPVFKGLVFQVLRARAVTPSGKVKTFERAWRLPSVSILAIDPKGRLILNREYRYVPKKYEWRLPAGRVDEGETPREAALRELREETGFGARRVRLFHVAEKPQSLQWDRYTFLATGLVRDSLPKDEEEDISVVAVPLSRAMRMVRLGKVENETMAYLIYRLWTDRKKYAAWLKPKKPGYRR